MKTALILAMTLAIALAGIPTLHAQVIERKADPLADKVKTAIDKGVTYLREQGKSGRWENDDLFKMHSGALTSLALLALLNCGVPVDDDLVKTGLENLRKLTPASTYSVSLQTMAFAQAGQGVDKERIQRNVDWLLSSRLKDGWTYQKGGGAPDNSNTQYAVLALNEGRRAGANVDPAALKDIQEMYKRLQNKASGAWDYSTFAPGGRFTMTTAGVCGLLITGMNVEKSHDDLFGDGKDPKCGKYDDNKEVTQGLAWLAARFPAKLEAGKMLQQNLKPPFYLLYGLERAGRLSGERFLGDKDWYRIGCEFLVQEQLANGTWQDNLLAVGETSPLVATSFALLFLSKGRTPMLWTKMAWGQPAELGWNNKHNDARYLTEFASKELFKNQPMGWQIFDIRNHEANTKDKRLQLAEELLQSPIVCLSGHYLSLNAEQKEVLKAYLDNGGFLFAEACCNEAQFDRDFKKLMREFYDSDLTPLDASHAVWTAHYPLVSGKPFKLLGMQQGCKTVVIYSQQAISGYWEANKFDDKDEEKRGTKAFQLGANIIAYATGLEPPKPKGYEIPIVRDSKRENIERGYLKVAQLRYSGGSDWQPAPKAMRNLMEEVRKVGVDVVLETRAIDPADQNVVDYPFLYMHGRKAFAVRNKDDLKSLRFNLEDKGAVLFADACCGSKDFDASFRKLIETLWPDKKLEPVPVDDELFSKELNGVAITKVRCRREGVDDKAPDTEFRSYAPLLEGIKIKGRWVVIYSKYDIGCALEHNKASDCKGHDYESAVLLGRAAVLYALKR